MKRFCLFIGYPRSGSTISGRLLDLHPLIGIAHQVNVFQYDNIDTMFNTLLTRMYNTQRLDDLDVIGSKSGHQTVKHLLRTDYKLETFKELIDMPLKILHLVRNPYDNLATWVNRAKEEHARKGIERNEEDILNDKIVHYHDLNKKIQEIIDEEDVFTYKLDRLIKKPGKTLKAIYDHLEVPYNGQIITQAKSMVYEKQRITRNGIKWTDKQANNVDKIVNEFDFLKGYKFDLSDKLKEQLEIEAKDAERAKYMAGAR